METPGVAIHGHNISNVVAPEASTSLALRAMEEANGRVDRLFGELSDRLSRVLLSDTPNENLISAVRSEQSSLGSAIFEQVDALHGTCNRLERLISHIDL